MSLQSSYKFPHLDTTKKQIRLLRLQPKARQANLLQYELRTFDLETAPDYQALSYTWGPEFPTYPIRVNNRKHHVRANLYTFLKGVAIKDYMWIDQICIDQSDSEEKSFVVKMMSQIYRDCDSMTIWLGSQDQGFREAATDFIHKPRRDPLRILLHDDYFTRLWVVQEVLLARSVRILCRGISGIVEVPWNEVRAVATGNYIWLQDQGHSKAVLELIAQQGMKHYQGLRLSILRFSGYNCENPRDKVYGLLGIVKEKEKERLEVDYTKSVQEVFVDVIKALRESKMDQPDILSCRWRLVTLARQMNLGSTDRDLTGLRAMLQDVFSSPKTARSLQAKLPVKAKPMKVGFDDAQPGAGLVDDQAKRLLARWWFKYEGKKYHHACCVCASSYMCRCNPGRAIIRNSLEFPVVAIGIPLTAKQKKALSGAATKADSAKIHALGKIAPGKNASAEEVVAQNSIARIQKAKEKIQKAKAEIKKAEAEIRKAEAEGSKRIEMKDSQAPVIRATLRTESLVVETGF